MMMDVERAPEATERSDEQVADDNTNDNRDNLSSQFWRKFGGVKVIAFLAPFQIIAFAIVSFVLSEYVMNDRSMSTSDLLKYSAYQCLGMSQGYFFTMMMRDFFAMFT